ncbi:MULTISPECIES: helix-turn-helix domain-containing protein [Sphingobacterium]|uniref:helix-turn-helix domain-containing protein n=1 Tax=Sphingobacterium TaxID=28453 RepID=UPI00257EB3F4|nr:MULTISPECIES: helix-turn-helix transcriptional regulator [Sphingobacterium]
MEKSSFEEEGKLVRAFREELGKTAVEFAKMLDTSVNTLSNIENGKRRLSGHIIKGLSKAGMSLNDITYLSKNSGEGQSFAYRLAEVENRLITMESTLKKILALLDEKR